MISKLDLDAILALAEGYEARMKLARSFFDRREPVPEEHKAYLAILDNDEAVKAFETLRPLVEMVRGLEKERFLIIHAIAGKYGRSEAVELQKFLEESKAEQAAKETGE